MEKAKIAVMVSGGEPTFALIDAQNSGIISSGEIVFVLSNNASAYALTRAKDAGIEAGAVLRKQCASQEDFEAKIIEKLEEKGVDLIVLCGIYEHSFRKFYQEI